MIHDDRPRTLPRLIAEGLQLCLIVMLLALAIGVVIALCTGAAQAEPCKRAHAVQAQDPVPCGGVLLPEGDARKLLTCVQADLPECEARLATEKEARGLDAEKAATLLSAATERGDKCCSALDECATIVPPEVPWHRRPEFVAPVAAALSATAAVLLTLWGVGVL